jgi:hypothetical protein
MPQVEQILVVRVIAERLLGRRRIVVNRRPSSRPPTEKQ